MTESALWIVLPIALLVVSVVVASRKSVGGTRHPSSGSVSVQNALATPLPADVRDRALDLVRQGQKITAIKELRQATGYGLLEAKEVVEALAAGHGPGSLEAPAPPDRPAVGGTAATGSNLAERARKLRAEGQEVQAIRLVCDETGMSIPEAQNFVRSLGS